MNFSWCFLWNSQLQFLLSIEDKYLDPPSMSSIATHTGHVTTNQDFLRYAWEMSTHILITSCGIYAYVVLISLCQVDGSLFPKVTTTQSPCPNDQRHAATGLIQTSAYPLPYDPQTCQHWFISGDQNDIITISFEDLDIPADDSITCFDSYVHLGPEPDHKYCDRLNGTPIAYISKRDHVWIRFWGSGKKLGRGFKLRYTRGPVPFNDSCLDDEFRCANGKCIMQEWTCNGANECGDRSDEINCQDIKVLTTLGPGQCGDGRFGCNEAEGDHRFVCLMNFHLCDGKVDCLDGKDEQQCEHATKACGGPFEGPAGFILTPNFPSDYPIDVNCEYLIHVVYGSRIQLRFVHFSLQSQHGTDFIVVYDGGSDNSDLIGKYYGGNRPPNVIESTYNRMFIKFHSDHVSTEQGFNATYQIKGHCIGSQIACGHGEANCYDNAKKCDDMWDCPLHGGDELGCGVCSAHLFACALEGTQCFSETEHCNGISHCSNKRDELDCDPVLCGPHNGTFLCKNRHCIFETWKCDGTDDCEDASDEIDCSLPSVKVITAAVIGSLICGLLLVIALGCTCKLYALRLQESANQASHLSSSLSQIQEALLVRQLAPPPYHEAMLTSRPFTQVQQELQQQQQQDGNQPVQHDQGHGQVQGSRSADGSDNIALLEDDDELIDITENIRGTLEISPENIPCNSAPPDSSHVRISIATGMTAHWRRKDNKTDSSTGAPPGGDGDCASISTDSMILSLEDDDLKDNIAQSQLPASPSIVMKHPSNQNICLVSCDEELANELVENVTSIQQDQNDSPSSTVHPPNNIVHDDVPLLT